MAVSNMMVDQMPRSACSGAGCAPAKPRPAWRRDRRSERLARIYSGSLIGTSSAFVATRSRQRSHCVCCNVTQFNPAPGRHSAAVAFAELWRMTAFGTCCTYPERRGIARIAAAARGASMPAGGRRPLSSAWRSRAAPRDSIGATIWIDPPGRVSVTAESDNKTKFHGAPAPR